MFELIFAVSFLVFLATIGIVLGVIAFFGQAQLAKSVDLLQSEIATLRRQIAQGPPVPAPAATDAVSSLPPVPVAASPAAEPVAATAVPPLPEHDVPVTGNMPVTASMRWLEELAGGRLSVLLGGLALALGGIFLVRYSIVQGLLGPGARILLGAIFAAALAAGAEALRRNDAARGRLVADKAYVPGALMGAAIVTAFATIYAAYGLYGFLGPATAFALLGACSLAGLAIASRHGPGLAALGLLGSYGTPLLVHTDRPDAWLLFGYLLIVSFAAFFAAHLRRWLCLAIAASVAADAWLLLWEATQRPQADTWPAAIYVSLLTALAVLLLHDEEKGQASSATGSRAELGLAAIDRPLSAMLAGHGAMAVVVAGADPQSSAAAWVLSAMSLIACWAGWSWRSLALAPAIGAAAVVLAQLWARDPSGLLWHAAGPAQASTARLWMEALFGASYCAAGTAAFFSPRSNAVWPAVAAAVPLCLFAEGYWLEDGYQSALAFGLAGAVLAIGLAVIAEQALARPRSLLADWAVAVYAAAAVAALALALTMVLEKGWLTVALAAMAPGIAVIERYRPVPVLRWLVAGLAALVIGRLLLDPGIVDGDPGHMPVFNWLLYAYGVPALSFWYAGRQLLKHTDDVAVKSAEGASILLLAALLGMQIRHLMGGGSLSGSWPTLAEYGLHTINWLGLALGLRLRAGRSGGRLVPRYAALGLGGLGILAMLGNTLLLHNPVLTGEPLAGGLVVNDLVLAYLIPAMLAGGLYAALRGTLPNWLPTVPAISGFVMAFAYVSFETARWFEGPVIAMSSMSESELYTLSVVWLLFALAMLAAGIGFHRASLRQAAFGVLLLVTLKVFLVDLAGLTGLLQAGSFIGLGMALIGIGLAYQRLVLRAPDQSPAPTR